MDEQGRSRRVVRMAECQPPGPAMALRLVVFVVALLVLLVIALR